MKVQHMPRFCDTCRVHLARYRVTVTLHNGAPVIVYLCATCTAEVLSTHPYDNVIIEMFDNPVQESQGSDL